MLSIEEINKKLEKIKGLNDPSIFVFELKFENNYGLICNILDENCNIVYNHLEAFRVVNDKVFFQVMTAEGKVKMINTYAAPMYINYNYAELNKV